VIEAKASKLCDPQHVPVTPAWPRAQPWRGSLRPTTPCKHWSASWPHVDLFDTFERAAAHGRSTSASTSRTRRSTSRSSYPKTFWSVHMKATNHPLRKAGTLQSLGLPERANVAHMQCIRIGALTIRDCNDGHCNVSRAEFRDQAAGRKGLVIGMRCRTSGGTRVNAHSAKPEKAVSHATSRVRAQSQAYPGSLRNPMGGKRGVVDQIEVRTSTTLRSAGRISV
jgi:hypothetical protein